MRIILILLSLSLFVFIGWLGITMRPTIPTSPVSFSDMPANQINTKGSNTVDGFTIEQIKHQMRTEQELADIKKQLEQITGSNKVISETENSGKQDSPQVTPEYREAIPVSAKFLAKILPAIELKKITNSGIFDLRTFDHTAYSTYSDEKFGITVVASMLPYKTFLKNFQALEKNVYTVNEKTPFPFESFYVNPPKPDASVRIVIKVEAQTLLISLPKSKFNTFKELILKTK